MPKNIFCDIVIMIAEQVFCVVLCFVSCPCNLTCITVKTRCSENHVSVEFDPTIKPPLLTINPGFAFPQPSVLDLLRAGENQSMKKDV